MKTYKNNTAHKLQQNRKQHDRLCYDPSSEKWRNVVVSANTMFTPFGDVTVH